MVTESTEPLEKRAAFRVFYPHPESNDFLKALPSCDCLFEASVVSVALWLTAFFRINGSGRILSLTCSSHQEKKQRARPDVK